MQIWKFGSIQLGSMTQTHNHGRGLTRPFTILGLCPWLIKKHSWFIIIGLVYMFCIKFASIPLSPIKACKTCLASKPLESLFFFSMSRLYDFAPWLSLRGNHTHFFILEQNLHCYIDDFHADQFGWVLLQCHGWYDSMRISNKWVFASYNYFHQFHVLTHVKQILGRPSAQIYELQHWVNGFFCMMGFDFMLSECINWWIYLGVLGIHMFPT